jgi:hypothetical protein
MPNGGNWDRFWFTIVGFNIEFGRWPNRLRLPRAVMGVVVAHLAPADLERVRQKLELLPGDELAAEDGEGARYVYNGPPYGKPNADPQEWLGVRWS